MRQTAEERDACPTTSGEGEITRCAAASSNEGEPILGPDGETVPDPTPQLNSTAELSGSSEEVGSPSASLECDVETDGPFPSDRANFPVDISDNDLKRSIIRQGPCQFAGP